MVIPSNVVIGAIGAPGYPASLVGIFVFLLFAASVLFGLHEPTRHRHPIQVVLCVLWLSVLASYVLMDRGVLTVTELTGADRMLIKLAVITGVALVAAEWLQSVSDVRRVAWALCWGGAFCGLVAALQYWFSYDVAQYLRRPARVHPQPGQPGDPRSWRIEPGNGHGRHPDRARGRRRDAPSDCDPHGAA